MHDIIAFSIRLLLFLCISTIGKVMAVANKPRKTSIINSSVGPNPNKINSFCDSPLYQHDIRPPPLLLFDGDSTRYSRTLSCGPRPRERDPPRPTTHLRDRAPTPWDQPPGNSGSPGPQERINHTDIHPRGKRGREKGYELVLQLKATVTYPDSTIYCPPWERLRLSSNQNTHQ